MNTPEHLTISKIKEVAECLWWRKTSRKRLAEKCNLTEEQVYEIQLTRGYREKVEDLMLSQRSLEDFEKWIKKYHKQHGNMNTAFGEHMGLDPKVVPVMVENVRRRHAAIAAGEAKTPKMIQDPRKNVNMDPEKSIGSGRNSVYLYYDQRKRDSAESKGENVWECKIGMTIQELHTRIYQQAGTAVPAERLKIGLRIKIDKPKKIVEKIEGIIHDILKVRGKHIEDAPGREWFLTSLSEVEEIYNFIGENSHENASSTLS